MKNTSHNTSSDEKIDNKFENNLLKSIHLPPINEYKRNSVMLVEHDLESVSHTKYSSNKSNLCIPKLDIPKIAEQKNSKVNEVYNNYDKYSEKYCIKGESLDTSCK
jgi:hypothetical protein